MKKLLVIAILMLALIVTAVACNNDAPANDTVTTDGETDRATQPEETTAEDVTTEEETTEEVTTEEVTTEEVTTEEVTTEEVTTEEVTTEEVTTEEVTTEEPADTEPVLVVDKTTYEVGEAIMVTATGSGFDWVGISTPDATGSMFWWYVEAVGNQTAFDLMTTIDGSGLTCTLEPGVYEIRLIANDNGWTSTENLIASTSITVVAAAEAQ